GFTKVHNLLLKTEVQLTSLEKDILSAIYWLGKAAIDYLNSDKLVKIVVSIDLLLSQGRNNKKETIAKRYSSIVFAKESNEFILYIYNKIQEYYIMRNEILHAGRKYIDEETPSSAELYAKLLVATLLKYVESYQSISALIEKEFSIRNDVFSTNCK
ncbi:MAG: hypothetical protein DA330_09710, partial [Nitrososphaera sp.]|nr:hypothetical protein [Nitrososphaera sp.]